MLKKAYPWASGFIYILFMMACSLGQEAATETDSTLPASVAVAQDFAEPSATPPVDTSPPTTVPSNSPNPPTAVPPTRVVQTFSDCTGRTTRLGGATQARVIPGGGPNNLRDAPSLNAGRISSIPENEIVTLLSGPQCFDGHMWWQVSYDGQVGWTSEGTQSSQYLSAVTVAPTPVPTTVTGRTSSTTAVVVGATDTPVVTGGQLSGAEGLTWSEGPLTAAERADLYSGSWVNENVNTNSITRIEIAVDANNVPYMHWWGKCHPQDCDNGTHQVTWRNPLDGGLFFHTTTSFSINDFTFLALTDGRLWVQKYTEFTDNSGRQPYTVHEYFIRQ